MEDIFRDGPRNPVPYRTTRTFPNFSQPSERRFEPSWARSPSNSGFPSPRTSNPGRQTDSLLCYTRESICDVIASMAVQPSPLDQSCQIILSEEPGFAQKLLDKSYYTPDPSQFLSRSYPKSFESRGLSGRGRGRGMDYGAGFGQSSFESNMKYNSFSRGPTWRSRYSSESSDLPPSYPRRRVYSERSHSESHSEGLSESPGETGSDWQYFPGDQAFGQEDATSTKDSDKPNLKTKPYSRSISVDDSSEEKQLSWLDTSSIIKSNRHSNTGETVQNPNEVSHLEDKERAPHSYSFLNPSRIEPPDVTSNVNQSNSILSVNTHYNARNPQLRNPEANQMNNFLSNVAPVAQDPRHLWYYIDPKRITQGPFSSEQMDSWFSRSFFPPSLPVWRECDSEPFKLESLLNITDRAAHPFSLGAERLLMSREFSHAAAVERKDFLPRIPDTHRDDASNKTDAEVKSTELFRQDERSEATAKLEIPDKTEIEIAPTSQDFDAENCSEYSSPEEQFEIVNLCSPTEEVFQINSLESSQETANDLTSPDMGVNPRISNSEQPAAVPMKNNMWLSGPPKIPAQIKKSVGATNSDQTPVANQTPQLLLNKTEEKKDEISKEPLPTVPVQRQSYSKATSQSTSATINNFPVEDRSGWTKVGLDKKPKGKMRKPSQAETNQNTPEEPPTHSGSLTSNPNKSSSRSKLDELDSFWMGGQNFSVPLQNDSPILDFDSILAEQSEEERTQAMIRKSAKPARNEEPNVSQKKRSTWAPVKTEIAPSFLDIEKEQKTMQKDGSAKPEKTYIKETKATPQPPSLSTWARVTQNTDDVIPTSCKPTANKGSSQIPNTKTSTSETEPDETVIIPIAGSTNEISVKPKHTELASKSKSENNVPEGILLSQACYESVRKEIASLNKNVDPPTVISFLQDFNSLFEITQLGSEMLGTSERTNALCKRICEDLARAKKAKQKTTQAQSAENDWVKVGKTSGKPTKKKGKPSKSSEV